MRSARIGALGAGLALLLAGCDAPSPGFAGADRRHVTLEGVGIDVYLGEKRAQAIIPGSTLGLPYSDAERLMLAAIRAEARCDKVSMLRMSDKSVLTAKLDC